MNTQSNKVTKKQVAKPNKGFNVNSSLKGSELKRKQVYKPVLENPYIKYDNWPYIDRELGLDVATLLCGLLSPIGNYEKFKKNKKGTVSMDKPEIVSQITIGFNSTNKTLEDMSKYQRKELKTEPEIVLSMVFVCKVDITPELLTKHLPLLTLMASQGDYNVKLVQLPRGSMQKLSECLNTDNTGIIGISSNAEGTSVLQKLVQEKVSDIDIPWVKNLKFQSPNIKLLVTTQPMMKKKDKQKKVVKTANPVK